MKYELDDDDVARILKSLAHEDAYLRSQQREDYGFMRTAEKIRAQQKTGGTR